MRLAPLFVVLAIGCSHDDAVDPPRVPSDLYPIVSPLVGGNTYASAHPADWDIARDPNEVPATPLADGARVVFTVSEVDTVIAPAEPSEDPPKWAGANEVRMKFMAFGATTTDPSVPKGFWSGRGCPDRSSRRSPADRSRWSFRTTPR